MTEQACGSTTYAKTPLPTEGAIIVLERTDDLVLFIGNSEGACKRRARWHIQYIGRELVEAEATSNMGPKGEVVKVICVSSKIEAGGAS